MDFLLEALTNWLKEMLVGGIMGNLSGMFDSVNQQVGDISVQVGQTPQGWNGGIFSMIVFLVRSKFLLKIGFEKRLVFPTFWLYYIYNMVWIHSEHYRNKL